MRLLALVAALLLALAATATAQERRVDPLDVEDEVMCVSCNVPLFIAESVQADRQRALIRRYADEGLTKDQIKARLVDEYGEDVLAMPESDDGIGLTALLVPIIVVLALIAAAAYALPRWRTRTRTSPFAAAGPPVSDAELHRLDDDLRRFDR